MTKVEIIGNLTRDIEIAESDSRRKYARFTVAVDRGRDKGSKTDFFRITAFDVKSISQERLKRGAFVRVTRFLRTSEYEGRSQVDIIARSIERYAAKEEAPA